MSLFLVAREDLLPLLLPVLALWQRDLFPELLADGGKLICGDIACYVTLVLPSAAALMRQVNEV